MSTCWRSIPMKGFQSSQRRSRRHRGTCRRLDRGRPVPNVEYSRIERSREQRPQIHGVRLDLHTDRTSIVPSSTRVWKEWLLTPELDRKRRFRSGEERGTDQDIGIEDNTPVSQAASTIPPTSLPSDHWRQPRRPLCPWLSATPRHAIAGGVRIPRATRPQQRRPCPRVGRHLPALPFPAFGRRSPEPLSRSLNAWCPQSVVPSYRSGLSSSPPSRKAAIFADFRRTPRSGRGR